MIQKGRIYDCLIHELGIFQVQVLNIKSENEFLVRVVRCTTHQKDILKKVQYRFHVPLDCLLQQSADFSHVEICPKLIDRKDSIIV